MTIVCYISQWKRMSLSAVRNAGAEKTRCETRGCAVFIFLHASRYLFPAVQRDVGRLNPLLVPRNSKTRLPRNTEVCERRSFLGCFCEKSSFSVIRASVNVGHRFCKSRRRDIGQVISEISAARRMIYCRRIDHSIRLTHQTVLCI